MLVSSSVARCAAVDAVSALSCLRPSSWVAFAVSFKGPSFGYAVTYCDACRARAFWFDHFAPLPVELRRVARVA